MVLKKYPRKILSLRTKTSNLPTFLFLLYHSNESRLHSRKAVSRRWSSEVFRIILQVKDFAKPTKTGFMHTTLLNHTRHWMSSLWWHGVIINFFKLFFSLVKFSYRSKFHVNIITGSEVMIIFFYKGLTKNPEIPPSEFRPISGDSGELEIPNLERMSLMKCY